MKPQPSPNPHPEIESVRVVWLAAFVSVFSFLFYQRQGEILLYGDAVAHINIARRIFDSQTPGLLQLGTVWLPLPHLLILPFIIPMRLWQSGTGGSIPSMAGYIFGVFGIFRLTRTLLNFREDALSTRTAAKLPWAAAILYAANPNLIYLQATAMGESLYLALFIWAVIYFAEFARPDAKDSNALTKCAWCLFAACLTRYDGWFLASVMIPCSIVIALYRRKAPPDRSAPLRSRPSALVKFILIAAAAPVLWVAYNAIVYGNPLEFANGPYSAKAIEQKTATVNPAKGNVVAAASYFLKAAELDIGEKNWQERLWLALALLGLGTALRYGRWIALLLLAPLPFYAISIAYGSIPIFVPTWWPFSTYNLRYGLELLPAFAVLVPLAISFVVQSAARLPQVTTSWRQWEGPATFLLTMVLVAANYAAIWKAEPICYREALVNSRGRIALEEQLAKWFASFPPNSTLLMYLGEHSGALEMAGIPLRRVINEGNHRIWKQPDPQGLWERALADPAAYADFAIGFEGDPVWKAAKAQQLTAFVEIHTTGQAPAAIFPARAQLHR
jgi:hypothetical protein